MLPEVTEPEVRNKAATVLIRWLYLNVENKEITPEVADFQLRQLTKILPDADKEAEAFKEMKNAVGEYQQSEDQEPEKPPATGA